MATMSIVMCFDIAVFVSVFSLFFPVSPILTRPVSFHAIISEKRTSNKEKNEEPLSWP